MYYIRVNEGKNEKLKKEDKMRISILISVYTVRFAFLKVYTKFISILYLDLYVLGDGAWIS